MLDDESTTTSLGAVLLLALLAWVVVLTLMYVREALRPKTSAQEYAQAQAAWDANRAANRSRVQDIHVHNITHKGG